MLTPKREKLATEGEICLTCPEANRDSHSEGQDAAGKIVSAGLASDTDAHGVYNSIEQVFVEIEEEVAKICDELCETLAMRKARQDARLQMIVQDVVNYYDVRSGALVLFCSDALRIKASVGLDVEALPLPRDPTVFSLFFHHIRRQLPIILYDASSDARTRHHELVQGPPHIRFYVGAPLINKAKSYIGTLCIMDDVPRDACTLNECGYLVDRAAHTAETMEERHCMSKHAAI